MYTPEELEKYTKAEKVCMAKLADLAVARSKHDPASPAYLVLTIDMHNMANLYAEFRDMKLRSTCS